MKNRIVQRIIASVMIIALSSFGLLNQTTILAAGAIKAAAAGDNARDAKPDNAKPDNPDNSKDNAKIDKQMVGQLTVFGVVTLNEKKAVNGTTVLNNSKIKVACAKGNGAIVNFGRMGRIELNPGTEMVLRFSDRVISGDLIEGNVMVNASTGVKVSINTQDGVTASDGKEAAVLPVKAQRGVRCVPTVMNNSASSPVLSPAAIAALLLGAGGVAAIGALAASNNNASAVQVGPPPQN